MELDDLTGDELDNLVKEIKAEKGLEDLIFFNAYVLDHESVSQEMHGELCQLVGNWKKNSVFLMPRGTFKSSVVTEGWAIQQALKNRNLRILIYCETFGKAVEYVLGIRDHLETDEIKRLYGNVKDDRRWREDGIRLSGRTKVLREVTFTPHGLDKSITGMHFDIIICDDLIGDTNTETPEQLEKAKKRFQEVYSLLDKKSPHKRIVILGTVWDLDDLYCDIITKREKIDWEKLMGDRIALGKDWNIYLRQAKENGILSFPSIISDEDLLELSRNISHSKLMMQYYNNPLELGSKIFEDSWRDVAMKSYEEFTKGKTNPWSGMRRYLVVDPAISKNPKADYTGMIALAVNEWDRRFVYGAQQERFDTVTLINGIFDMADACHVNEVIIEANGFQKVLVTLIQQEKMKRGKYWKLTEYNPGTSKSKEQRIETLVGRLREGKLSYSAEFLELDKQVRKFPSLNARDHDDLIDALSISEIAIQAKRCVDKSLVDPEDMVDYAKLIQNTSIGI